jgi:protein-S-isoprenylcysteine O-methyltransferase Ste14
MARFILITSILAELSAALAVVFSMCYPGRRIWPPDPPAAWKRLLMGFLFLYPAAGIGILGGMSWGDWAIPGWIRFLFGIPLLAGGEALFLWAAAVLGFAQTFGGSGTLVRIGPFRFSRNPQYVGCLVMLIGWSLLSASKAAAAASLFGFPPLWLVPFAEETWLRKQYGPTYEEYRRRVPRFL